MQFVGRRALCEGGETERDIVWCEKKGDAEGVRWRQTGSPEVDAFIGCDRFKWLLANWGRNDG